MTNPTERELSDRLADALEKCKTHAAELVRQAQERGENCRALLCRRILDDASNGLALHRAQRDGERRYRMLVVGEEIKDGDEFKHWNTGEWTPHLPIGKCGLIGASYGGDILPSRRPLAKGEA